MTLRAQPSHPKRLAALLAATALMLLAPFATLCVAGGHTGIELLYLACCGDDGSRQAGDCAGDCTDTPADFGASLVAKHPAPIVPTQGPGLKEADVRPPLSLRLGSMTTPRSSQRHDALSSVLLLI